MRLFRNKERRLWRQQWRFNDKMNGRLEDVISGIRVVKSFGQEKRETERFQEYVERQTEIQRRNETFWATLYPFVTFIITCRNPVSWCISEVSTYSDDTMTPGQLVQFMAYAGMAYTAHCRYLSAPSPDAHAADQRPWSVFYDVLDEESDVQDQPDKPQAHRDRQGEVKFDDVSFRLSNPMNRCWNTSDLTDPAGGDDRVGGCLRVPANPP